MKATSEPSEREFIFLLAAISGTTALGIDFTLPAFDDVSEALGVGRSSSLALIVTVYFLGLASMQTLFGPLADRFGRKIVLNAGLVGYVVSAFVAGAAPSFELLLISRFFWGVAAGAPRAMTLAIARDVYQGDRLARVVAASTAAFMLVPAMAPVLGQGVLDLTNWRFAFAAPGVVALVLILWVIRLPETQRRANRRPLSFAKTGRAIAAVVRTKSTLGFTLAMMFDFASFGSFLSNSAQLFADVFDRDDSFAVSFGVMSLFMGLFAFIGSRLVTTVGATRMLRFIIPVGVAASALGLAISWIANGSPSFWPWFGLITLTNATRTLMNSLAAAEAMGPMGSLAGTAAAVTGTIQLGGGALLATVTDRLIDGSVTPLMAAYLGYGLCSWAFVIYAQRHKADISRTEFAS